MKYINKIKGVFKMNKWFFDLNDFVIKNKKDNKDILAVEELRTSFNNFSKIVNANQIFDLLVESYNKLPIQEHDLREKVWNMIDDVEKGKFEEVRIEK